MFDFEILTNETEYNYETNKSTRVTLSGRACGCIEDHLAVAEKKDGFIRIGDIIIPSHKVLAIRVKAVTE